MRFLKRFCCIALSIIILSLSIGTKYFDSNHMENVNATAETVAVGLSAAAMYAICFYVGTLAYANAPIETNNLSDDQIAAMGYSTISYIYTTEALNSSLLGPSFAENPVMFGFVDKLGQSYVFGSNAVKEVAETSFQVIQGGKKPDDDNDDDDEGGIIDNLIKFPGNVKNLSACCSTGFAALLGSIIREQYDKHQNGEESIYDIPEAQYITDSDVQKQKQGGYVVHCSVTELHYKCPKHNIEESATWEGSCSMSGLSAVSAIRVREDGFGGYRYSVSVNNRPNNTVSIFETLRFSCGYTTGPYGSYSQEGQLWSANIPIFTDYDSLNNYLTTGTGYENAFNYIKEYRIADWQQEDWAGILKDPLTGLTALGNLANIARHQGLNALGNEIDTDAFNDYLRDYFANTDPDEYPLPSPNPLKVPILWPTGALDPETSIDPSRNPAILPDPNIKPDPDPGVNPNPDPGTDPTPDVIDIPVEDVVPTVNDSLFDVAGSIRYKFPFSIPWDLRYLFTVLADTPKAPYFELPIVIERYGINEKIIVDLKPYEKLSVLSRSLFSLLFAIGLIKLTFLVVGMRKEE